MDARNALYSFDFEKAISLYQGLADTTDNKETAASAEVKLGNAYILSGNAKQGISQIKRVIADESLSGRTRAWALSVMTNAYYHGRDKKALQLIFDDSGIYKEAMEGGDINNIHDLEEALHRLYLIADTWDTYHYLSYVIALQPANDLLDNPSLTDAQKKNDLQSLKDGIREGDKMASLEAARSDFLPYATMWVLARQFRFFNLLVLARYDQSYEQDAQAAYEELMTIYAAYPDNQPLKMLSGYTRFYYAAYLAEVYGAKRAQDIASIIKPTTSAEQAYQLSVWRFYQNEMTRDKADRNHNEKFILSVATYDADFDAFLISRGWKKASN